MKRIAFIFLLTIFICILLFSCLEKPIVVKRKVTIQVNVTPIQNAKAEFFKRDLKTFEDEIDKVYLTVENNSGLTVYSTETTQKYNISFNFTLDYEGTYTFKVEAKRADGSIVFKGETEQEVKYDQQNIIQINAYFENGTLRASVTIANEIWERYFVECATITVYKSPKEDFPEPIEERTLVFEASEVICDIDLYPGAYDVEFKIFLSAKDVNIEPYEWTNEGNPTLISVQISPSKVKPISATVLFDTEIKVVMNSSNIDVPYIPGVQNLNGAYNMDRNELVLTWEYPEHFESTPTFYIYKEINESYYEYVGKTLENSFTISNITQAEYEGISGVAVNVIAEGKQSGFTILSKANINIVTSQAIYYKNFAVTRELYAYNSDWDAIVQQIFGNEYRVADWNDLKAYYSSTGNILELLDGLGMTNYRDNAFVTCNGQRIWGSDRYYFIERHDHNLPYEFLAHDHIDNYAVSLGSWDITTRILAIRK